MKITKEMIQAVQALVESLPYKGRFDSWEVDGDDIIITSSETWRYGGYESYSVCYSIDDVVNLTPEDWAKREEERKEAEMQEQLKKEKAAKQRAERKKREQFEALKKEFGE